MFGASRDLCDSQSHEHQICQQHSTLRSQQDDWPHSMLRQTYLNRHGNFIFSKRQRCQVANGIPSRCISTGSNRARAQSQMVANPMRLQPREDRQRSSAAVHVHAAPRSVQSSEAKLGFELQERTTKKAGQQGTLHPLRAGRREDEERTEALRGEHRWGTRRRLPRRHLSSHHRSSETPPHPAHLDRTVKHLCCGCTSTGLPALRKGCRCHLLHPLRAGLAPRPPRVAPAHDSNGSRHHGAMLELCPCTIAHCHWHRRGQPPCANLGTVPPAISCEGTTTRLVVGQLETSVEGQALAPEALADSQNVLARLRWPAADLALLPRRVGGGASREGGVPPRHGRAEGSQEMAKLMGLERTDGRWLSGCSLAGGRG